MITFRRAGVSDAARRPARNPQGSIRRMELALPELQPASNGLRCRRFVGNRPSARNGECGLAAKVILDGQPLCYVHTPVVHRRALVTGRGGPSRLIREGDPS